MKIVLMFFLVILNLFGCGIKGPPLPPVVEPPPPQIVEPSPSPSPSPKPIKRKRK